MAVSSSYKILSINDSSDEYIELEKLFRNEGKVVRPELVKDIKKIPSLLSEGTWSACFVYHNDGDDSQAINAIDIITSSDASLPIIVISNKPENFVKHKSVFQCVSHQQQSQLIAFSLHAFKVCDLHRELLASLEKNKSLQDQVDLLLSESDSGVAYISDGMLIKSNEIFASQFGFTNTEDLDYFPLFDLIDSNDHERLKQALAVEADGVNRVVVTNELGKELSFECSAVLVDEEHCTQIKSLANADNASAVFNDEQLLCMELEKCLSNVKTKKYSVFYSEPEDFQKLRAEYGYSAMGILNDSLLNEFNEAIEHLLYLSTYNTMGVVGIVEADQASVIDNFQRLFDTVNNKKFTINDQSLSVRFSHVGGVELNLRSPKDPIDVVNQLIASFDVINDDNCTVNFDAGNNTVVDTSVMSDEDLLAQVNQDIENDNLSLLYHPVINLRGGDFDFYEVLLSKNTGELLEQINAGQNYMASLTFEKPDTVLDHWIVIESSKMLANKVDDFTDVRILINLSVNALRDNQLASWLSVVIKAGGIEPSNFILQFKGSDIRQYSEDAVRLSKELKELGFGFSISHFDGGSLSELQQLTAEFVKFSDELTDDITATDSTAIKNLVTELNESSVNPIIPNITQAAALAMLWQVGAKYIQGSYLADPMPEMSYEFTDIA